MAASNGADGSAAPVRPRLHRWQYDAWCPTCRRYWRSR
jgi:hypothetical protein